jgi:hypothetical protein
VRPPAGARRIDIAKILDRVAALEAAQKKQADRIEALERQNRALRRALRGEADAPEVYSTRKGHTPPGWNTEGWRGVAESVPGSYRPVGVEGKPGRWVVTPRAAYEKWQAARATKSVKPNDMPATNDTANGAPAAPRPWTPADALREIGRRFVDGGGR